MGSLLRSQPMKLIQLYVQIEAAHDTVDELGKIGLIQFRDLNPDVNAFQRNFVNEVKRADEIERKLRYFKELLIKQGGYEQYLIEKPANIVYEEYMSRQDSNDNGLLDDLEIELEDLEQELIQITTNQEALERGKNQVIENLYVLDKDDKFIGSGNGGNQVDEVEEYGMKQSLLGDEPAAPMNTGGLNFITGVILREKIESFERLMWRAMRGNLYMRQEEIREPIKDPATGEEEEKSVFIVFYSGSRAEKKITKLCEAFGANIYDCPTNEELRLAKKAELNMKLEEVKQILERTEKHNAVLLGKVAVNLAKWEMEALREKSIYHTMNMFNYDTGRRCLIAEGWCPENATDMEKIYEALRVANERSGALVPSILSVVDTKDPPPSHFVPNRFTQCFQVVVEAYGIPRYGEVNPTPFTIITFPFLFGVMFGDVGHGFLLFLVGALLLYKEKEWIRIKLPEMVDMIFDGRYLFFLMTLFSMYGGLMYNEFFGLPVDIFGTNWYYDIPYRQGEFASQLDSDYVYPMGVDPMWKGSENELDYYNSLKMKMSVLMGVTQMLFGICLSCLNAIHFKQWLKIFLEFIPQMIFILSIFGYMNSVIIMKWVTDYQADQYIANCYDPPSILNLLIQMFLTPFSLGVCQFEYGSPPDVSHCVGNYTIAGAGAIPTPQYSMFLYQTEIQVILAILAVCAVPWMLFPKPLIDYYYAKKEETARKSRYETIVDDNSSSSSLDSEEDGEHFELGEHFTHQGIHTIEYVLGCVSNTASYLRLWALSLAHAELAEVFWTNVMEFILHIQIPFMSIFLNFAGWAVWAALTIAVLLVMESLSAFLHALRLQWVEFQNKFYMADGHKFIPFSYVNAIRAADELSG